METNFRDAVEALLEPHHTRRLVRTTPHDKPQPTHHAPKGVRDELATCPLMHTPVHPPIPPPTVRPKVSEMSWPADARPMFSASAVSEKLAKMTTAKMLITNAAVSMKKVSILMYLPASKQGYITSEIIVIWKKWGFRWILPSSMGFVNTSPINQAAGHTAA